RLPHSPASLYLTSPTPLYLSSLSLHDALPIFRLRRSRDDPRRGVVTWSRHRLHTGDEFRAVTRGGVRSARSHVVVHLTLLTQGRSEEHTSELQSRFDLVCRLLLEKKKYITRSL